MLTLIEGGFASLSEDELISRIKSSVERGIRTYLFVPEQQTVTAERTMCELLPKSAPLNFEVTNFTRFVNTSFRTLGGISGEYCDRASRSLIMWRTLTELSPMLYMTERSRTVSRGIVERAERMVGEMESLAISPEDIAEIERAGGARGERLKRKLSDLSLVYSLYKKTLGESFSDMTEETLALAELIREREEYLLGAEIYVDGFTSFTEPQYRLLSVLISRASVAVRLTLPRHKHERYEYSEVRDTERRLLNIADKASADKRIVRPTGLDISRPEIIPVISELLFTTDGGIDNDYLQTLDEDGGRVRIFSAETPSEECAFVADDIKKRVMHGAAYSDFAVISGTSGSYDGFIDRALRRAGIPYYMPLGKSGADCEAVKLIRTSYRIILRGFSRDDVITYMKSGLVGITKEESDIAELYIEKWGIDGRRFTDEGGWQMNPRGYEALGEDDYNTLALLEDIRLRLVTPLFTFSLDAESAKTVREQAEALFRFISDIKLEERLRDRALTLLSLDEHTRAEEMSRMFGIIMSSLDKLVLVSGDAPADAESFENQLSVVLSASPIGTLPSHIDEVTVGSADAMRVGGKRHVYLIGVNEGVFPSSQKDSSYFTDADKAELSSLGLAISPTGDIDNARGLYSFTRAFTSGRESVTLTYPKRDAALTPIHPSSVIARIGSLTDKRVEPRMISTLSAHDRLYSPASAYKFLYTGVDEEKKEIREALVMSGHADATDTPELSNRDSTLGKEALAIIYKGDLYLSQSRIEAFLDCPFSYFLKYGLKLGEDERAELKSNVIGSFIHAILEDFFREVRTRGISVSELTSDERLEITDRAAGRFIKEQLGSGYGRERTKIAISRLSRSALPVIEGLVDELSACKFEPTFFELSTDGRAEGSADPVIYERDDGRKIILRGKVDRTDTYRHGDDVYVRVVDYKTGAKNFSPNDLEEGRNLQMFLYLKAIVDTKSESFRRLIGVPEGGELIPAGVIYAKTSIKDATVKHSDDAAAREAAKALSEREGMVLDDDVSLSAMNPAFTPLSYPENSRNQKSNAAKKYTREGWSEICRTIEDAVLDISARMTSGKIPAEPKEDGGRSACDWCSYRAVCRK